MPEHYQHHNQLNIIQEKQEQQKIVTEKKIDK